MAKKLENRRETFFKVQDNIPMPPRRAAAGSKYEWDKLTKVGQSVFLLVNSPKTIYTSLTKYRKRVEDAEGTRLKHRTAKWQQKGADGKEVSGFRVWLTEINKSEAVA